MDVALKALTVVGALCVVCYLASLVLDYIADCFDEWEEE